MDIELQNCLQTHTNKTMLKNTFCKRAQTFVRLTKTTLRGMLGYGMRVMRAIFTQLCWIAIQFNMLVCGGTNVEILVRNIIIYLFLITLQ